MSASILFRNRDGDEVQISLHPISLALVLAEAIEEVAQKRCRRMGHGEARDGFCERCGNTLPDGGSPYGSWLPDAYRTIRHAKEADR